jgi:peroxiredoxin
MIRLASVVIVAAALIVVSGPLQGQQKIGVGDACPTFKLPGVDGKEHTNAEFKKDALVICITCNHCPVAIAYEDRMIEFAKKFGGKVDLVAINVNNHESDKMPKMIERSKEKGFNFSYLYDESQTIARSLGATVTPHFFVFDKNRKLVYSGAMDDNVDPAKVSAEKKYLEAAVAAVTDGKAVSVASTKAVGCPVMYEKGSK